MFEINKKSEVPLYQQLVHSIKKYIEEGILKDFKERGVMCLLLKFIRIGQILVSFMMT